MFRLMRVAAGSVASFCVFVAPLSAQAGSNPESADRIGTIIGRVLDRRSSAPVDGVRVFISELGIETLTDADGRFLLADIPDGTHLLRAAMIGYQAEEREAVIQSNDTVRVDFELWVDALALDAVVVTGTAGGAQVRSIGNVVTSISAGEVLERRSARDLQAFLPAEVPGLSVRAAGGAIGAGGILKIRGASSMSVGNQPLIFIDGVRVDNRTTTVEVANFSRTRPSRLNDLPLNEIESIEAIKGPAAATLYGTEASNGVVQIITKKGRQGEPRFEVALRAGSNLLWRDDQKFPVLWGRDPETGEVISANLVKLEKERGTPIFRTGHPRSAFVSVSGGSQNLRYFLSADAGKDEGILSYQWQDRLAARSNLSYTSGTFEAGMNLGLIRQTTSNAAAEQAVTWRILWGSPEKLNTPSRGFFDVPHEAYHDLSGEEEVDRMIGGLYVRHQPIAWFSHRLHVGGDFINARSWALWPRTAEQPGPLSRNIGQKDVIQDRTSNTTLDYVAVGQMNVAPSVTLESSGGIQYYRKRTQITRASGEEFPVPGVSTVSAAVRQVASEDFLENKTLGVFLQGTIGWRNRIFVTGAIRGDDNSAFGENFTFVTYPKVSATWVASEEPFWEDLDLVNTLRLRTAWGRSGQQPDVFAASRLYEPTTGPDETAALTPSSVGNPDLKPEVGEELEVGFDTSLLDERVTASFTYFWQRRRDAIFPSAARPSFGFPGTQFINIGEVSNRGMELEIGAQVVRAQNWDWDLGFNLSTYKNRVEELGGIVPPVMGVPWPGQRHMEGFPVASLFMKKVVHAEFGPNGELANVLCEGGDPITGGGPAVPCDEAGTAFWGQPTPSWDFGATTTLRWRNLQLSATADGIGGYVKCNGDIAFAHVLFRNTRTTVERSDPIHAAYDAMGASCQLGLVDAGFAKLRDVSLRYELPSGLADRIGAERASISVSAQNFFTLWQAQKESFGTRVVDPEVHTNDGSGDLIGDMNAYVQDMLPVTQRINVTLRASF